jgi:hypothetical protein
VRKIRLVLALAAAGIQNASAGWYLILGLFQESQAFIAIDLDPLANPIRQ